MRSKRYEETVKNYFIIFLFSVFLLSCQSAQKYRENADKTAERIIAQKQLEGLGKTEPFTIELPSETFRKKLFLSQNLPYSATASLGTKDLSPIKHWPKDNYLDIVNDSSDAVLLINSQVKFSLIDALQLAAESSRDYQSHKEDVFRTALGLDLERDDYRTTFSGLLEGLLSSDHGSRPAETGVRGSAIGGISQKFKSGVSLSSQIAVDLAKLLNPDKYESFGISMDNSISIPLMRGSGKHIAAESLTQAERDVIYTIWDFERYKRTFCVNMVNAYLSVLEELQQVTNAEENYRGLIASARRARRLADAGRLPEFQFDQAIQDELRARTRWIQAQQSYASRLDSFKITLGLPTDAEIELDPDELINLRASVAEIMSVSSDAERYKNVPPADAEIILKEPGKENAGPMEIEEKTAIDLALKNRLDLRVAEGEVYDAQRGVVIAADALRAEFTLLGTSEAGARRSVSSADSDNANLHFNEGYYSALLSIDLPIERTRERNDYRESWMSLESAVRNYQSTEDQVKLEVRNNLRDLLEYRENLQIQSQAVTLAERRVKNMNLLLEAGRAEIRDLLDAQEALLSAQNSLTSAVVNYRIAELAMQRDLGVLEVNEKGLWKEFSPSEVINEQ